MTNLNEPGSLVRNIALSEIHAILHRYAMMAREKVNFNDMVPLFHHDAAFCLPNGLAVKPTEIGTVIQGEEAKYIRHNITTVDVYFTSEVEARTTTQFFATTELSSYDHWGAWEDIFQLRNGKWLIAHRAISLEGMDPVGWAASKYPAMSFPEDPVAGSIAARKKGGD